MNAKLPFFNLGAKCEQCIKINVCTLVKAIAPLMENWNEEKPFEASQLAVICKEYLKEL